MKKIGLFLYDLCHIFLLVMIGWTLGSYLINGSRMVTETAWFDRGLTVAATIAIVWAFRSDHRRSRRPSALGLEIEDVTPRKRDRLKLVK